MTNDDMFKALGKVQEPDLGKDLVTLNMVRDIDINGNNISFTVVLTTPACPLKELLERSCVNAILEVNKDANVTVNFTSSTTSIRADKSSVLPGVKNIIAVVSGKGGVGRVRWLPTSPLRFRRVEQRGLDGCRYLRTQCTHHVRGTR